jgi:hypothetical protein
MTCVAGIGSTATGRHRRAWPEPGLLHLLHLLLLYLYLLRLGATTTT